MINNLSKYNIYMINNLSRYDIYFILIIISLLYLFYKDLSRKEEFEQTEYINTTIDTCYNTDIEAIKKLSDIATKLTDVSGIVVPGDLQINGKLNLSNNTTLSTDEYDWITLHQTNDPSQYKSLSIKDLRMARNSNLNINGGNIIESNSINSFNIESSVINSSEINNRGSLTTHDFTANSSSKINGTLFVGDQLCIGEKCINASQLSILLNRLNI
jgi:hypothetical protein